MHNHIITSIIRITLTEFMEPRVIWLSRNSVKLEKDDLNNLCISKCINQQAALFTFLATDNTLAHLLLKQTIPFLQYLFFNTIITTF